MLRVRTFGGLTARVGDVPVPPIRGAKARSLFAYLAARPGPHPRTRLAGLFWPDVLETSARGSLRSALWAVRAALEQAGAGDHLLADRTGVRLDALRGLWVDLREFARLVEAGDVASLEDAVRLADAPPLPELADEWVLDEQDLVRERLIEALLSLAGTAEERGDRGAAVTWTRRALVQDRLRESTHRALMRRLARAGDRAGALAAYRRCRDVLAGELGVTPSPETRALLDDIRTGTADDAGPAVASAAAARAAPPRPAPALGLPALEGRAAEMAVLRAAWADAVAGHGGVAFVEGAAGIGKSRLVAELLAEADAGRARTAVGHVTDIEDAPPFAAWSDALRRIVRACPAPPADARWPEELARLCPAVETAWGRHPGPAVTEPTLGRARLFESVMEALDWCQCVAPTLVVLEDAHAGDGAGLTLAAHLGPRLSAARVLLVVTTRGGSVGSAVARVRATLRRQGAVRAELVLAPLASDAALAIVRAAAPTLDTAAAGRVADGAAGSPLLALRAARAAGAGADPEEAVCDAVRVQVADLPDAARALVALVAVAGRAVTVREAIAALGPTIVDGPLDAAVAAGLLEGERGSIAFVHDLLRRACHAELSAARRRAAHRAMAEVLVAAGRGAAAEVAHHLRGAGDEERARAYLRAAATAARALGALDQAAAFLREAALSAHGAGDAAAEGEAWIALAEIEAWRGDRAALDDAFGRGRRALEDAGDIAGLAAALAERGRWLRTTTCYPAEVHRSCSEAVDLLDRGGIDAPETRLLAVAGMAWGESVTGDVAHGAHLQDVLARMLRDTPDPILECEHLISRAFARLRADDMPGARALYARAAALADEHGRPSLALDSRISQANAAASEGHFEDVLRIIAVPIEPVRVGHLLACQALAARAHALSHLGRHDEAVATASEQIDVARGLGLADVEAAARADLGAVLIPAGRAAEALALFEGVLAEPTERVPRAATRLLAVEAALAAGDPGRAREHLDRFPFDPVRPGDQPATLVARLDRAMGLLRAATGDTEGALRLLDAAMARWRAIAARHTAVGVDRENVVAVMVDLGRAPVSGLTEPRRELARIERERAALTPAREVV